MPLIKSPSKEAFKSNLKEELKTKPKDQALAISYSIMRRAKKAKGGEISTPWYVRNEARSMAHTGPIKSIVPGRTDNHPMNVPAGAYVLPADHVSHLGQGNSQAGMATLDNLFKSGPYNTSLPKMGRGSTIPKGPKAKFADGGTVEDVPIMAAGGEYVLDPEQVMAIGGGDLDMGHKILDKWVLDTRKQNIKTLKGLPGPAR